MKTGRRLFISQIIATLAGLAAMPLLRLIAPFREPFTISHIMQVSAPAVMKCLGRRYTLGMPMRITAWKSGHGYLAWLSDIETGQRVPILWTDADERRQDTENQRISLVASLLENGADSLTDFIEMGKGGLA
jgi:hypothetical protein